MNKVLHTQAVKPHGHMKSLQLRLTLHTSIGSMSTSWLHFGGMTGGPGRAPRDQEGCERVLIVIRGERRLTVVEVMMGPSHHKQQRAENAASVAIHECD